MRKLLYILLLLPFLASAQETPPASLKATNSQLYIHLPDSAVWLNRGIPYSWVRLGRFKDVIRAKYHADSLAALKLNKSGDNMAGTLSVITTGQDRNGIDWSAYSDNGRIYFESTGDFNSSSNLIFENGDNLLNGGDAEGFIFRKNSSGDGTGDPPIDILKLSYKQFTYKGYDVWHKGNLPLGTVGQSIRVRSDGNGFEAYTPANQLGLRLGYASPLESYTATKNDYYIDCVTSIFLTLPAPVAGQTFVIANNGSGAVTVNVTGGANINGATSMIVTAGNAYTVYGTGTQYRVKY